MRRTAILMIALLVCLLCACTAYAEKDGLYTYSVNPDNTVTITGYDWANNHGDIYIPEMLGNRMVSAIGEKAFATTGNTAVKITLPDNIRSIGAQAFRGVAITYVNIPLNTKEIGGGAFAECSVMQFRVENGHDTFATIDNALYNKKTKTLIAWPTNKDTDYRNSHIPNGIESIGDYVFYGRKIEDGYGQFLPKSLVSIGRYAFAKAELKELNLWNTKVIGDHAFEEAKIEVAMKNVEYIGDYAFYKAKSVKVTTYLENVSHIGDYAFAECQDLALQYGKGNDYKYLSFKPFEIGNYAFYKCKQANYKHDDYCLDKVTRIGDYAFTESDMIIRFKKKQDLSGLTYLGDHAFYSARISSKDDSSVGKSAIAFENEHLSCIPESAFESGSGVIGITYLTIGSNVLSIEKNAFRECDHIQKVAIDEGLMIIHDYAFRGCNSLYEINIPASVTMIGSNVFDGCSDKLVIAVEPGSYGEVWARTCGYAYVVNGQEEDTSWLN